MVYNPAEQTVYSNNRQRPQSTFIFFKQDNLVEIIYPGNNLGFSVLVFKINEAYKAVMLNRELANSLFVRLYFLNGMGLRHFKSFIDAEGTNDYLRIFNITWD